MLNKRLTTTVLTIVAVLTTGVVFAQGIGIQALPGSGWTTGQQIQNVGDSPANMMANVYYGGGEYGTTGVVDGLDNVPVGASRNILENNWDTTDTSFQGAGVVSSDQPIVAIVNVTNGEAAGQYQGVNVPDTEIGFPLFKNDFGAAHKHTTFYVQNASDTAAMIYATFKADSGIAYTWDSGTAVAKSEMVVLDPDDVAGMPTGIKGGLVVTSTVNIAGVVLEHGVTEDTILQATSGFSPADYGTELVAPLIKRQFGANARSTGLQVQNVSDAAVDIYITYVEAGLSANPGTVYHQHKLAVDPGASFTFYETLIGDTGSDTLPVGVLASATITATGDIAAIVNETYPVVPAGKRQTQTTYHAISSANATQEVGVPLAKEMMGAVGNEKSTGIQVQNVGATTATVDLAYAFGGSTYTIEDQEIGPGASSTFFKVSSSIPSTEWTGALVVPTGFGGVTVTADQNIVVIVQETHLLAANPQDNKNYEGFNLAP
jgi:hypothetical protein